jgi:phage-related protein
VESIPKLIPVIIDAVFLIIDTIIDNLPQILKAGLEILLALVNGIVDNIDKIIDGILEVIMSLIDFVINNLPMIIEMGIKIIIALVQGLVKAIPKIIEAIPQVISAIFKVFTDTNWGEIGKSILEGLANGLVALKDLVVNTLLSIAKNAINAFKSFFGINSPSTVFMGFGENINEGLSEGIEDNYNLVDSSLQGLKKLADNTFTNTYDLSMQGISPQNLQRGITNNSSSVINTSNNNFNLTIKQFVNNRTQDVKALVEEIEFYRKQLALAKDQL